MGYQDILKIIAPCGLNCRKCMASADGDIKKHSEELLKLLGSFEGYAKRFSSFMPIFENYPAFHEMLSYFAGAGCEGCRSGQCLYSSCGVMKCIPGKGVDFCFQCSEFPCEKTNFDGDLKRRWIEMNTRMKQVGVEAYYEETRDLCRYR